MNNENSPQLI